MGRSKSYTIAGRDFPTQRALEETVRVHLDFHPFDERFWGLFLADVINTLDQRVIESGQHANGWFERLTVETQEARGLEPRPGPLLLAQFEPSGAWKPVSAYPWRRRPRDHRAEIVAALREVAALYRPEPAYEPHCAVSGCPVTTGLQLVHVEPTWTEIAEACLALMTPEEICGRFGYNRFAPGRDNLTMLLPAAHPAIRHLLWVDAGAITNWRCAVHAAAEVPAHLAFSLSGKAIR